MVNSGVIARAVLVLGLWAGLSPVNAETAPAQPAPLPLAELRTFAEVFNRIKVAYVEEVDDRTLLENAISGMLNGLDPHSSYLRAEDFADLQEHTTGEFGGLGIEVGMEDGFLKVIAPIDETPAQRAGIESGDLIIRLDDRSVQGMGLQEAVELMRGKPGSKIRLTIMREGVNQPLELTLKRAVIKVKSVRSELLEPGYGYLRITQFQLNTGSEMLKQLRQLAKAEPLHGLVLDLRNNPGGVLQAAVEVVDAFLDEGLIVYTEGRIPNSELRYNAAAKSFDTQLPLVVLINGGSASASEIVAGALQDHQRAVLMGTPSFGKGSVQTVLPLGETQALKLTTALYYTPNGRSIQAQGIEPDIRVERAKLTPLEAESGLKEKDLAGHLSNGNGGADGLEQAADDKALAERDYQLYQALSMLKGLYITRKVKAS